MNGAALPAARETDMYWNRFRYALDGGSPWGYFGRMSGPETSPDYLITKPSGRWATFRMTGGAWSKFGTARTLKEAKRLCAYDFVGRYNIGG
jgi:hypothetical protein